MGRLMFTYLAVAHSASRIGITIAKMRCFENLALGRLAI